MVTGLVTELNITVISNHRAVAVIFADPKKYNTRALFLIIIISDLLQKPPRVRNIIFSRFFQEFFYFGYPLTYRQAQPPISRAWVVLPPTLPADVTPTTKPRSELRHILPPTKK